MPTSLEVASKRKMHTLARLDPLHLPKCASSSSLPCDAFLSSLQVHFVHSLWFGFLIFFYFLFACPFPPWVPPWPHTCPEPQVHFRAIHLYLSVIYCIISLFLLLSPTCIPKLLTYISPSIHRSMWYLLLRYVLFLCFLSIRSPHWNKFNCATKTFISTHPYPFSRGTAIDELFTPSTFSSRFMIIVFPVFQSLLFHSQCVTL